MEERSDPKEVFEKLVRFFPELETSGAFEHTMEELDQFVREQVLLLLHHNPSLLISILYRIDVAEHDVKWALSLPDRETIARELARLMIERERVKLEMRSRYR